MVAPVCPECGSQKLYKDGFRYLKDGTPIQRYVCRVCGYRFSNGHNNSKSRSYKKTSDAHGKVQLLMEALKDIEKSGAGATEKAAIKGKIIEFAWQLKKDGHRERTIQTYTAFLNQLTRKGADLFNPESVKEVIAKQKRWSETTKCMAVSAYHKFTVLNGIKWNPPKYRINRKLPFIPLESEIDSLIASCGKKMATILQLLKETGMRIGEALKLKWTDIDVERKTLTVNNPEKHGCSRIFKISDKLVSMLNQLPKDNINIFGNLKTNGAIQNFNSQKKNAARKLGNPRLLRITFHTLRHWKATMEYHKTKDILHVMKLLGHRNIQNTLIYTQLVNFESDEYHSATAETVEEAKKLIEAGFEYVCTTDNIMLFRKRK